MKTPYSTTTPSPRFLLLGDSHAGPIGAAARTQGLPFSGGPLGAGRDFSGPFFDLTEGGLVLRDGEMNGLLSGFLHELGVNRLAQLQIPLVSTLGLSLHFYATTENWECYRVRGGQFDPDFLGSRLFDGLIAAMAQEALAFYERLLALGLRVWVVLPPQRVPSLSDAQVFMAAQECLLRRLTALGVEVIDIRAATTDAAGLQRPEFCEADDPLHGNLAFGQLLLQALVEHGL
ncbi:MAG: hypothetical protein ABWY06_06470 [Pseudomonas sp.]|uniref:hypothetical protein n=1 Tax=Pseudomonas sp. TaxID=306 RepID=UPI00339B7270